MRRGAGSRQTIPAHAPGHVSAGGRGVRLPADPVERREARRSILGSCGLALAVSAALYAGWQICNFPLLFGDGPLLPAVREAPPPATYRPAGQADGQAGQTDGGCTEAVINRQSGETTSADCDHT
jgi:hypothetical protein